ncbi:MAG: rhomboid family intramembrane serine protease [Paludibacter sp.]|nr:rhomboid family intramembrane serine protease [Paludibacter sp.]
MNSYRPSFLSSIPPVVKNLIAINLILWLATILTPGIFRRWDLSIDLTDVLGMHYWASEKFNPAQLITYMFMHGGFGHVFFNMFALYMFGGVLENFWGPKRFLIYYLITGIGAGIVQQLFWTVEYQSVITAMNEAIAANSGEHLLASQHILEKYFRLSSLTKFSAADLMELKRMFLNLPVTVGASGSVFGLLLAFGWLFPDVKLIMLFFPVPIRARIFVLIYGVAELFLGVANFSGDSVAHFAHLGGMLFGIILILIWKKRPFKF